MFDRKKSHSLFLLQGLTFLDGVLIWWILAKKKKFLGPFDWFVNFWIMKNRIRTLLFFRINQENAVDSDLKIWCCNPSNLQNWLWILALYLYSLYEWGGEAIYLLWSLWKWSSRHIRDEIGNYIFDNGRRWMRLKYVFLPIIGDIVCKKCVLWHI